MMNHNGEPQLSSKIGMQNLVGPILCEDIAKGIRKQHPHIQSHKANNASVSTLHLQTTARTRRKYWNDDDDAEKTRVAERRMAQVLQSLTGIAILIISTSEHSGMDDLHMPMATVTTKDIVDNLAKHQYTR